MLLLVVLACLCLPFAASGQLKSPRTGKNPFGSVISRAELDEILARHKLWLASLPTWRTRGIPDADPRRAHLSHVDLTRAPLEGADLQRADLSGAILRGANLIDADLTRADLNGADLRTDLLSGARLTGADLTSANLSGVNLGGVNLRGVLLRGANLSGAHLRGISLSGVDLSGVDLSGVDLSSMDLRGTKLTEANLTGVDLTGVNLRGMNLRGVNLTGVSLSVRDLTGANLTEADMTDVGLIKTKLAGACFEPKNLPRPEEIAQARGLDLLRYRDNPGPLSQLRKQFQDAGFREQERAITYVLNRHDADPAMLRWAAAATFRKVLRRPRKGDSSMRMSLSSFVEGAFKWVAFDLTCQYGLSPGRPLRIVFWLWLFFSVAYSIFIHRPGPSGIYFIGSHTWRRRSNTQGLQIRPRAIRTRKWWKIPFLWLRREWHVFRAAMFFSLMSAFNIGFRDINFGRWLRMLTTREYDLKAVGWARTVSGFQSLLSVYMIALWVLTYFGRPFG